MPIFFCTENGLLQPNHKILLFLSQQFLIVFICIRTTRDNYKNVLPKYTELESGVGPRNSQLTWVVHMHIMFSEPLSSIVLNIFHLKEVFPALLILNYPSHLETVNSQMGGRVLIPPHRPRIPISMIYKHWHSRTESLPTYAASPEYEPFTQFPKTVQELTLDFPSQNSLILLKLPFLLWASREIAKEDPVWASGKESVVTLTNLSLNT